MSDKERMVFTISQDYRMESEKFSSCTPEAALWTCALIQGIHRALKGDPDDQYWVFIEQSNQVGSFRFCCEVIGVDHAFIRTAVLHLYDNEERISTNGCGPAHFLIQ